MKNEVVIKPLRRYEVHLTQWQGGDDVRTTEAFTADDYEVIDNCRVQFLRTGNIVREYFTMPNKVVVTPADEQVPQ